MVLGQDECGVVMERLQIQINDTTEPTGSYFVSSAAPDLTCFLHLLRCFFECRND
jgi:hypothetical protein